MATNILIAGASGLIGSRLTEVLLQKGYEVSLLGRTVKAGAIPSYLWNPEKGSIDPEAIRNADCIINLAGAGVADRRWTAARKREIGESRIRATALLSRELQQNRHHVRSLVAASAIGYYGPGSADRLFVETDSPGSDFLAQVVKQWEEETTRIAALDIRVVKLRIGIVLSEKGGALKSMARPVRFGFGAALGTGKQFLSWIHIDDLCNMFVKALEEDGMAGVYNAVSVQPVTNMQMMQAIARILRRPLWLPPVPGTVLRLLLGEMAGMVTDGSMVSSEKIQQAGFHFQFAGLEGALNDLLNG